MNSLRLFFVCPINQHKVPALKAITISMAQLLHTHMQMAKTLFSYFTIPLFLCLSSLHLVTSFPFASGQIDYNYNYNYYGRSCPRLGMIVKYGVWAAFKNDTRIAASLLRLHFHDCFVNGCDASILLDDTIDFRGEKNAFPNRNSVRGYEVIESIKADVENACSSTVSCADILTIAARESVLLSGGPYYPLSFGRRDGLTASEKAANEQLPSPIEPLENITAKFTSKGLDMKDVAVLSGAHTIGFAQCFTFKRRLFDFKGTGKPDPTLESLALTYLQGMCPNKDASNSNLAPLDYASTYRFDNAYYVNLVNSTGLLESDQALMGDPRTAALVTAYSSNSYLFSADFASSMTKLSNLGILTGSNGQIRKKCGSVN